MRILMIGMDWYPNEPGGLNRYFYTQAHTLTAMGIPVTALVSYLKPGQTAPFPLQAVAELGATRAERLRSTRRLVGEILRAGLDVINPHFALYAYPWLRDRPAKIPMVCHFHGPWAEEMAVEKRSWGGRAQALVARRMERAVYRRSTRLITLSNAFRDIAHRDYDVPLDRIRVIPGGMDLAPYLAAPERKEARARLGWPEDAPILLTVRRLYRRMGLENLIDAMDLVRRSHPNVRLLMAGTGPIAAELEDRIQQRGLTVPIKLIGFLPEADLPLAYAAADLSIVPTTALEGFGLITVESLASGTPVLGTPIGGTQEILRDLTPNLLFDSTSPAAMADRIDAALAGRIALPSPAQCRAYSLRYSWPEVIPCVLSVFEEAGKACL